MIRSFESRARCRVSCDQFVKMKNPGWAYSGNISDIFENVLDLKSTEGSYVLGFDLPDLFGSSAYNLYILFENCSLLSYTLNVPEKRRWPIPTGKVSMVTYLYLYEMA